MEISRNIVLTAEILDSNDTLQTLHAEEKIVEKYYSIKNLNMRINYMDLIDYQSKICNSSKDILLFGDLFRHLDTNNYLHINVSKWAKEHEYSRSKVNIVLKKAIDCGFIVKISSGIYFVNPFVIRGLGFKNNELFEACQHKWNTINTHSFDQDKLEGILSKM